MTCHIKRSRNGGQYLFSQGSCAKLIQPGTGNGKVIAAETGNESTGAADLLQLPGNPYQYLITLGMPVGFVDLPQIIQIQQEQRNGMAFCCCCCQVPIKLFRKQDPVGQPGQAVIVGQLLDVGLGIFMGTPNAQILNTKGKVLCQFFQQLHLLPMKSVGFRGIDGKRADYLVL